MASAKEKKKLEEAMLVATRAKEDAERRFQQHTKERERLERTERVVWDCEQFENIVERDRIIKEFSRYKLIHDALKKEEHLMQKELQQHVAWDQVSRCSRLPNVKYTNEITAFLTDWRDEQEHAISERMNDVIVNATLKGHGSDVEVKSTRFLYDPLTLTKDRCHEAIEKDLDQCDEAVRLTQQMLELLDQAQTVRSECVGSDGVVRQAVHLLMVHSHILQTIDLITSNILQHFDFFLEGEETSTIQRARETIRIGVWGKVGGTSAPRGIDFNTIGLALEGGKEGMKLSKQFNFYRHSTMAIRVVQLTFNPVVIQQYQKSAATQFVGTEEIEGEQKRGIPEETTFGQQYIALDCFFIVDHMEIPDQYGLFQKKITASAVAAIPGHSGALGMSSTAGAGASLGSSGLATAGAGASRKTDWTVRHETQFARTIKKLPFPPPVPPQSVAERGGQVEKIEPVKVRYTVPSTVVVRQKAPIVGAWSNVLNRWDPYGVDLRYTYERETRRASFLTEKLGLLALVQEKSFDMPYDSWSLQPLSIREVLYTIVCKKRNENSDAMVQILVRNQFCRVKEPSDSPELRPLREGWFEPLTLLRRLANSGYNFMLSDADAVFTTPKMIPKDNELEHKIYTDMSNLCNLASFASTEYNKYGEDSSLCLFRVQEAQTSSNATGESIRTASLAWSTIRYQRERCILISCEEPPESDRAAVPLPRVDMRAKAGCVGHLNLFMLLAHEWNIEEVELKQKLIECNALLRVTIYQLLYFTRPLSWG